MKKLVELYLSLPSQTEIKEWKPEIRMPSYSDYVNLSGLEWDTEYNVFVVAENKKGRSQPATMSFRTAPEPEAIAGTLPQNGTKQPENCGAKLKAQNQSPRSISNSLALKGE